VIKHHPQGILAMLALALLLGGAMPLLAEEQGSTDEQVALVGQLASDGEGGYRLIERESGDSIPLRGNAQLAEHVGTTVKVTGSWGEDPDGTRFLRVSKIERADGSGMDS